MSSLTSDERSILNIYIQQYNQTQNQIAQLQETANSIRENMQFFINNLSISYNTNSRTPATSRIPTSSRTSATSRIPGSRNIASRSSRQQTQSPLYDTIYEYTFTLDGNNSNSISSSNSNSNFTNLLNSFLNSSVVVHPTQEQIENSTRLVRYRTIEEPLSESCPISLERFEEDDMVRQIIPCGHLFCQDAFNEWFESNVRCPVCRYDIRNFVRQTNESGTTDISGNSNSDINNTFNSLFFNNGSRQNNNTTTTTRDLRDLDTLLTSLFYVPSRRSTNYDSSGNTY
jgi:hypothetical protein